MNAQSTSGSGWRGARLFVIASVLVMGVLAVLLVRGDTATGAAADPDLSLTKSDSPDPVAPGGQLTYTISVSNAGPDAATNTTVSDDLPKDLTFGSATASSGTCAEKAGKVTCNLGTVASTSSATVTIKTTVKQNPKAAQISNTASVTSDGTDPNTANNSDTEITTVLQATAGGATCFGKKVTLAGTPGDDSLVGTAGNDVIRAFAGNDTVSSGDGKDLVCTNGGADLINAGPRPDRVSGGGGPDLLKGGGGSDELRGNRGRDRLRGNAGPDLLAGGRGFDRCRGGAGRDILRSCER